MAVGASGEDKSSPSPPPSESPKNSPQPSKGSAPPPSSSPPPAPKENDKSPPPPSGSSNSPPTNSPPPSKSNDSSPPPPQEKSSPPPANNNPPPPEKTINAPPPENKKNSPPPANENNKTSPPPANGNNSPPPKENISPRPPNESNNTPPPSDKINAPPPPSNSNNAPLPPSPSIQDNSSQLPPTPLALSPPFRSPSENLPAPPKQLSPPKTSSTDDVTPVPGSSHDGTKVAAIASVAVAGGLLILVFAVFVIVCTRKKNKKHGKHMYYGNPPRGGGYYPNNQQNWQNANMSQDYNINLPLPPGGTNGFPPPPPIMSSGEMSSGYSGSHGSAIPPLQSSATLGVNQSQFTYEELAAATSGFSQANLLGQGGFGYVHKGVFPNGKEVAVKSLKSGSGQGDREFRAEVEIISRVHHRHLVSLVGFCILNEQKMLVYEFVPNNTLEYHLHGRDHPTLDWSSRLKIALGSARGLAYLHEDCHPRIIHRDIKASNILIDEAFEAKVADFGLAKLSDNNFTHVSTRVMGTFGYLAPEYASSGKLSEKSDVFSFGVMLLELVTGRRPVDHSGNMEDSLVDWARPLCQRALEEGNYEALVDPSLERNYAPQEMACMVACAAASIRHSARRRPKMSQVVRALEGDVSLDDLNEGTKPGHSGMHPSSGSSEYDASSYSEDMRKFRKMALGSQEYGSSDNGATSEYGLNPSTSSSDSEATRKNSRML